jgi:hypothetical protein
VRDGRTYYYLVESARVDGKPRIVSQQYLGSAEEVTAKLSGAVPGTPIRSLHKKFGDLATVWSVLARLDVTGIVDTLVPRRTDAGATTGTYLALAAANRIVAPCSKSALADWWTSTAGPRWVKLGKTALDHRQIWDALDRLDETDLHAIEAEIGRRIVARYNLDLSGLVLDMTNFATFIDTGNEAAPIASAAKPNRNGSICAWSAWAWSSPATAGSRWSPTPTPATGPRSPSSPRSSTNSSPATGN